MTKKEVTGLSYQIKFIRPSGQVCWKACMKNASTTNWSKADLKSNSSL